MIRIFGLIDWQKPRRRRARLLLDLAELAGVCLALTLATIAAGVVRGLFS